MFKETVEFIVPSYYLGALINGDFTGLSDSEFKEVSEFSSYVANEYGNAFFSFKRELGFMYANDMNSMGGDCSIVCVLPS